MSKWTIYALDGSVRAVTDTLELHDEWMAECFVTVTVKSPYPIDFHFGDYLIYRGDRYSINYDPNVVKKSRLNTYGEGFTYDSFKMYAESEKLKDIDFKDVVLYDNGLTYTSLNKFSFFADSVEDLADRIQANLNREGGSSWRIFTPNRARTVQRIPSVTPSEWARYYSGDPSQVLGERDVNIDITEEERCWQVLNMSYTKFNLKYYVIGRTIVIGGDEVNAGSVFRYGKGNGLYEIERTADESQEIITRLFAYGSEKNLPMNYYANIGKTPFLYITDVSGDGGTEYGISVPLEDVAFADGTFTVEIYDNGSNIRWYTVKCRYGGVEFNGNIEQTKSEGGTARLIAGTRDLAPSDVPVVYTTEEQLAAIKAAYSAGARKVQFKGGVNINMFDDDHIDKSTTYPAALMVNRLMLPGFPTKSLKAYIAGDPELSSLLGMYDFSEDPFDPWIQSKNRNIIGLREGSVNYDGSTLKEIYPTIENTAACRVIEGSDITDNGFLTDNVPTFEIKVVKDAGLDWSEAMGSRLEDVKISMTSGFCTGREFTVRRANTESDYDYWTLTLERSLDSSLNRFFPYFDNATSHYCQILAGDTFVVTGIQMPASYIEAASRKLLIAACGYLDKRDHMRYTYLPKVDEIYMARQHDSSEPGTSYHDTFRAGMRLSFEDEDLGISHAPFIDQLTIKEDGNNGIPTYDVVLRDEKEKGFMEDLADSLKELRGARNVVERRTTTVEYEKQYLMVFCDQRGYPYNSVIPAHPGYVNIPLFPKIYYGEDDITATATAWQWRKYLPDGSEDTGWSAQHTERDITLTDLDMPTAWGRVNSVVFECIATLDADIEIAKTINFG